MVFESLRDPSPCEFDIMSLSFSKFRYCMNGSTPFMSKFKWVRDSDHTYEFSLLIIQKEKWLDLNTSFV